MRQKRKEQENIGQDSEKKHKQRISVRSSAPLLFLRALLIAMILFCGYKIMVASKWYYPNDMFTKNRFLAAKKSKNYAVVGNYITSKEKVLEVMRSLDMPKVPLYCCDVKSYEKKIAEIKTIKNVHIRRYWFPAKMLIVIEDKMPILMIAKDEKSQPIAFFVEDATLLGADLFPKDEKKYPLKVLTTGQNPKDDYRKWDLKKINEFVELADKTQYYTRQEVEYIDARNPEDIFIKTKQNLIRLGKINDTTYSRLASLAIILPNLSKIDKTIEYVDVRWDVAKYVKVKEKTDEDENRSNEFEIG